MISAFNDQYTEKYSPSWISCLNESMNSWMDKFCPGFMCVPRKPHPFGNEYHSIADGDQGRAIMWRVEIVEGKDRPKLASGAWAYPCEFETAGESKTAALMLRMTKPIHGKGKVVTMDSGFCVTAGILALHRRGVFGQALIKKRGRYWPRSVPGDDIDAYFEGKELGETMSFEQEIDGIKFLIHCTKDESYVTKLMSTHGMLDKIQDHQTGRRIGGVWRTFKYCEPVSHHNRAKHLVDDHNNRRHDPIGLEQTWRTKWWPTRQFTFLLAIAEVNAVNSRARARKEPAEPQLKFRRELAEGMINNNLDNAGNVIVVPAAMPRQRRSTRANHVLESRPVFRGKWDISKNKWSKAKQKYQKVRCDFCGFKCRTFCTCDKKVTMCVNCFADHKPRV
ncbi:hypothetical protein ACHAXS_007534 [Conticribra weissflogii]